MDNNTINLIFLEFQFLNALAGALHFLGCVQFKFQETHPIKQEEELNAELQLELKLLSIKKSGTNFVCQYFSL